MQSVKFWSSDKREIDLSCYNKNHWSLYQITTSKEILNLQKLTKSFDGKTNVVDDVSFIVSGGEIFGFLGPNDAGKNTPNQHADNDSSPDIGRRNNMWL